MVQGTFEINYTGHGNCKFLLDTLLWTCRKEKMNVPTFKRNYVVLGFTSSTLLKYIAANLQPKGFFSLNYHNSKMGAVKT